MFWCALDIGCHRCTRFVSTLALKSLECRCDESRGKGDDHKASNYMEVERVTRYASKLGLLISNLLKGQTRGCVSESINTSIETKHSKTPKSHPVHLAAPTSTVALSGDLDLA
eukprot:11652763-Heterocapsa_arctica.AAC.1